MNVRFLVFFLLLVGCGGAEFTGIDPALGEAPDAGGGLADSVQNPRTSSPEASREAADGHDAAIAIDADAGPAPEEAGFHSGSSSGSSSGSGSGGSSGSAASGSPSSGSPSSGSSSGAVGCVTGAQRCAGAQPETCVGGVWLGNGSACSGANPVCLNGACTACVPGAAQCVGAQPQRCADGIWIDQGPACSGIASVCSNASGGCVQCSAGATQCAGGTQPQACNNGVWVNSGSPVTHTNGVGQTWQDCAPAGTYDEGQAMKACAAYTGDPRKCNAVAGCGTAATIIQAPDANDYLWGFEGNTAGYVGANGSCPNSAGRSWN